MTTLATATVTAASPLRITMHGDITAIPALTLEPYTPVVDDVVRVQVRRSGLLPIVQGRLA